MKLFDSLRGALVRRPPLRGGPGRLAATRPTVLVNTGLALAILGIGGWTYVFLTDPAASATDDTVRTVPVMQGAVTASVTADGTVESASTASATFATAGTVTEIRVRVGQKVKKGQVLAKVDATDARRELALAQANLNAADDALERAEDAGGATTEAESQVAQARLAVEEAQDGVDGTALVAPMAGTVIAINGSVGGSSGGGSTGNSNGSTGTDNGRGTTGNDSTSNGNQSDSSSSTGSGGFIDLADLGKLQIAASFSEVDATKLKVDQAATVTWNALPGTTAAGTVAAVDPNATTANNVVTYRTTLALKEVPDGAKMGQTVSVSVITGSVEDAVYVNSAAVTTAGRRRTVSVVDQNGQQTTRVVEVGLEGDQFTQILSGVTVGEQVVLPTTESTSGSRQGGGLTGGGLTGGGFNGGRVVPGGGRQGGNGGTR